VREHLRPQYSKAFQCIGSECEDTCCHGFAVAIDKATYQRYEASPEFQPVLETHFVRIERNANDAAYARIQLTASYNCPFLTSERMCGIQQEHGSEYLSEICASYPRATRRIDGLIEKALHLSCPEAARLVLLNPRLMQEDSGISSHGSPYFRLLRADEQPRLANGNPHQYLWEIRRLTLLLLQDRSYPLWQRLFVLGLFCKRLNELIAARQSGLVPSLLRDYAEIILEGKLRPLMDGIPAQANSQLTVAMEVIHRHLALQVQDPSHARFRECAQDFLAGIRYEREKPIENCVPYFADAQACYYEPFLQRHPYICENYLINHVFKTRFPFGVTPDGEPNDPQTEFLVMSFLYAAIQGLLIGMAGRYREAFSAEHVVKLVQSFSKAVEHCPEFLGTINPAVSSANGMAQLLKV
jgi:lysine-N-methylase